MQIVNVNLNLSTSSNRDAQIIKNLWPLYQHDISAFDGATPNRHGIFTNNDTVTTLAQHASSLDAWWQDPASLFPYLIVADGLPAGFNLIAASSRLPQDIQADFVVHEFFVLHAYRGSSVAERAAVQGFNQHRGAWEVVTYPTHLRAISFWRRVIGQYTSTHSSEDEVDHPWGRKVVFHFDNTS
ncbi:MAG: GNAT family N-acetyltransferase [Deinococcota bacterium]